MFDNKVYYIDELSLCKKNLLSNSINTAVFTIPRSIIINKSIGPQKGSHSSPSFVKYRFSKLKACYNKIYPLSDMQLSSSHKKEIVITQITTFQGFLGFWIHQNYLFFPKAPWCIGVRQGNKKYINASKRITNLYKGVPNCLLLYVAGTVRN